MNNIFTKCSSKSKPFDIMISRRTDKSTSDKLVQHLSESLGVSYYYAGYCEKRKYSGSDYDCYQLQIVRLDCDWDIVNKLPTDLDTRDRQIIRDMAKELNPNIVAVIYAKDALQMDLYDLNFMRYRAVKPVIYGVLNTPAKYIERMKNTRPAIETASNLDVFNSFVKQSLISALNKTGIFTDSNWSAKELTHLERVEQTPSGDIQFRIHIKDEFVNQLHNLLNDTIRDFILNYDEGKLKDTFNELHMPINNLIQLVTQSYKSSQTTGTFIFETQK